MVSNTSKIKEYPNVEIEYIYVYKNKIYFTYKKASENKVMRVDIDGSNSGVFVSLGNKMLKVYGEKLYYLVVNGDNYDLWSVPLDKSSAASKIVGECNCYTGAGMLSLSAESGDYHIRGNYLYYHKGDDGLWKVNLSTKTKTKISEGEFDNYTFGEKYIYFRYHIRDYSIGRDDYEMGNPRLYRDTDSRIYDGFALNLTTDWILYYSRTNPTKDLKFVSKDGTYEKLIEKNLDNIQGDIKIIGGWVYYVLKEGANEVIYRIKNDGTSKQKIKRIK